MLNKYFEYIRGVLRWVGLAFVSVACIFSMWSVSGYFLEQYHNISADATLISYDTSNTDYQIKDLQDSNKFTQEQISDLRKTLEQKREVYANLKNDADGNMTSQQTKINNEINKINNEISSLNKQLNANNKQIATFRSSLADLNKEYAEKSPEIQRLKPFAKMFGISDESTIVMAIIVLLTVIFDPFAIFLIFWGNRIVKLADEKDSNEPDNVETSSVIVEEEIKTEKDKPVIVEEKNESEIEDSVNPIITDIEVECEKTETDVVKEETKKDVEENLIENEPIVVEAKDCQLKDKVKQVGFKKQRLNPTEDEPITKKVQAN